MRVSGTLIYRNLKNSCSFEKRFPRQIPNVLIPLFLKCLSLSSKKSPPQFGFLKINFKLGRDSFSLFHMEP